NSTNFYNSKNAKNIWNIRIPGIFYYINIMNFHEHYSELLKKLPPSIKKNIWNRLISRVHNPLSEEQTSSIHSDIESLLISKIDKYAKKKNLQRRSKLILDHSRSNLDQTEINLKSNLDQTEINLRPNLQVINSEDEINARVKESTQETLNSIKQQKEVECNQIRLDMALKSRNLFEHILKKYIRDGTIYNLIHLLEEADGTRYPDISRIVKKN
ncbi:5129_t:CDS:1, partial [Diversispora eburnea]